MRWLSKPSSTAVPLAGAVDGLERQDGRMPLRPHWWNHLPYLSAWLWVDVTQVGIRISPLTFLRTPWWSPSMEVVITWDEVLQVAIEGRGLEVESGLWRRSAVPADDRVIRAVVDELTTRDFTEHTRPTLYPGRRIFAARGVKPDFRLGRGGESPEFRRWVRRDRTS